MLPLAALIPPVLEIGGKLIDRLFPDKVAQEKERAAAELALAKMTRELDLAELSTSLSAIMAEAQSSDPWTSRARPSFLYVIYVVILFAFPLGGLYVYSPEIADRFIDGFQRWLGAVPDALWGLFGVGYLGYSAARTYDKKITFNKK